MTVSDKPVRADRLLAGLGYGTRRDAASFIYGGELRVGDRTIDDPATRLSKAEALAAMLSGEALDPLAPLTILLHKPAGYVCSRDDAGSLVYDLLPPRFARRTPVLSCAGRLDALSTGMVILTDDGQLVHKIISPRTHPPKYYRVVAQDPFRSDTAHVFESGTLMLDGEKKPLRPVSMSLRDERTADLVLREGRYHQIRRMVAAVGNCVESLHRYRIGGLELGDLASGAYRILDERDVAALFADVVR
ncbi:MAG TPA: pseudouridine synthase [Alphaproteobacteria bacterium]|nr:pseudouridine synthase [Alphaproteobacteria bacterium]